MAYRESSISTNPNPIPEIHFSSRPPNFVRDRPCCFTWSPNHEEHHQSLMLRAWFLHLEKYAICPDRDLNPEPSDWRTCVRLLSDDVKDGLTKPLDDLFRSS